jgi:hypothetical protein
MRGKTTAFRTINDIKPMPPDMIGVVEQKNTNYQLPITNYQLPIFRVNILIWENAIAQGAVRRIAWFILGIICSIKFFYN